MCGTTKPILRLGCFLGQAAMFPQLHVEIRDKLWNKLPFMINKFLLPPPAHLSITARHSFLQVKRLPRRSRKVPGAVVMGGGVCLHSISSIGNGAGRMFRVAPGGSGAESLVSYNWRISLQAYLWIVSINCASKNVVIMCAVTVFTDEVGAVHNSQINHPFMETYVRMSITFCKSHNTFWL